MKEYTISEVRKHNKTEEGVWLIIDGLVYDVTKFKDHPGQFDILLLNAGTDVSKKFHTIHDESVFPLRDKFLIGKLVRDENEPDADFEVPNKIVDTDVPLYYYLLPISIFITILYFIFFGHHDQSN